MSCVSALRGVCKKGSPGHQGAQPGASVTPLAQEDWLGCLTPSQW